MTKAEAAQIVIDRLYEACEDRSYSQGRSLWEFFRGHQMCPDIEKCKGCRFWQAVYTFRGIKE